MESAELKIGQVATLSEVSLETLRYYERRRLLPRARRTAGGFRLFTSETVERVRFIKHAQELGFSLDEIGQLLSSGNAAQCRNVRDLLTEKLTEMDKRMKAMRAFRRMLAAHLEECERELGAHGQAAQCPVVTIKHAESNN
ncbi:MAG: MerR family transcriptional regulator [Pyrinomonadaceae bacterium]|nr:MerR family transcriptional regulator [Pyrinomonadaceae bacterium]